MPVLEVKNIKKRFSLEGSPFSARSAKTVSAVDGVTFSIDEGETLGLVGESGCGKTTLAKIILRLISPDEGAVLLRGDDVFKMPAKALKSFHREIQIIFQDPYGSLNPRMPVGRIIAEGISIHEKINANSLRERIIDLLGSVGLDPDCQNRYPHEFSGGQRQRIGIARALSVNPSIIIADEPVSSLDMSVQAGIINLMSDLQVQRKITYLFISHDLSVVRHVSSRILVMYEGKIVEEGPTEEIFEKPKHSYTKRLLSSAYEV